jgi:Transposase DDE domain group 1
VFLIVLLPATEVFQVKARIKKRLRNCKRRLQKLLRNSKRRIQHRLRKKQWDVQRRPLFQEQNIHYDIADKTKGLRCAGLGAFLLLVHRLGLTKAIDDNLHLLKRHVPYFESDHVLNLTYNLLVGGKTINDLELLRTNELYLDVLGAQRIPDPTTAGDFLRRFKPAHLETLLNVINTARLAVWKQQPEAFFAQAIIAAAGTIVETTGACKQGLALSYNGLWGYHPLLLALANTQEPLVLVNRSGNRPSHEGAAASFDRAAALCRQAGFRQILFRGDTDFTQTAHLDRWQEAGIGFVFGIDAQPNLVARAAALPARVWATLARPARYEVATVPRRRPTNVKEEVVHRRGYRNLRLVSEQVAEFNYQPGACAQEYLIVVVRKQLVWERRGRVLEEETR